MSFVNYCMGISPYNYWISHWTQYHVQYRFYVCTAVQETLRVHVYYVYVCRVTLWNGTQVKYVNRQFLCC